MKRQFEFALGGVFRFPDSHGSLSPLTHSVDRLFNDAKIVTGIVWSSRLPRTTRLLIPARGL